MLLFNQIEIGVNKFKNGNAQFYHRLGVAPKKEQGMMSINGQKLISNAFLQKDLNKR